MLGILIPFFFEIISARYPRYTMISVRYDYTEENIKELEERDKEYHESDRKGCELYTGEAKDICLDRVNAQLKVLYGLPENIDELLSSVPKESDYLYLYVLSKCNKVIDFNKLNSKMVVVITSGSTIRAESPYKMLMENMKKYQFDGSKKSLLLFAQSLGSQKIPNAFGIEINGKLESKVSFLTLVSTSVTFVDNQCDCETVYLSSSKISSNSLTVKSKYLIIDTLTYKLANLQNFQVENFHFNAIGYSGYGSIDNYDYKITYEAERIRVIKGYKTYFRPIEEYFLPYEYAGSFGVILHTPYILIDVDDVNLDSYKPLNLTHLDWRIPTVVTYARSLEKDVITIVADDNWENVPKNKIGKITFQADLSKYEIQKEGRLLDDLKPQEVYTFKSNKDKKNIGLIIGIVVAVVVVIIIIIVVVVVVVRKKKNAKDKSSNEGDDKV